MSTKASAAFLALCAITAMGLGKVQHAEDVKPSVPWSVPLEMTPVGKSQLRLEGQGVTLSAGGVDGPAYCLFACRPRRTNACMLQSSAEVPQRE